MFSIGKLSAGQQQFKLYLCVDNLVIYSLTVLCAVTYPGVEARQNKICLYYPKTDHTEIQLKLMSINCINDMP